jgi:hypothetical protein
LADRYSIDTDSLIWAWYEAFPPIVPEFEVLWERTERLIGSGILMASEEVRHELSVKDGDALYEWARVHPGLFRESDERVQRTARDILAKHRGIVDQAKGRSGGDPWVIALALVENATVITEENRNTRTPKIKPKIPDVCDSLGVRCIKFVDFVQEPAWLAG